jgi:hypothetical protein
VPDRLLLHIRDLLFLTEAVRAPILPCSGSMNQEKRREPRPGEEVGADRGAVARHIALPA